MFNFITENTEPLKIRVKNGEMVCMSNDDFYINIWLNDSSGNFCLECNSKIIVATKTFTPIEKKLSSLGARTEFPFVEQLD